DCNKAVMEVVHEAIIETKKIRFEGNNYAEEWAAEAERRGLPNLRNTPAALAELQRPEAIEFFAKTGIASAEEVEARYHIKTERYIKDIEIEIHALKDLVRTMVLPAAFKHQATLATAVKLRTDIRGSKTLTTEQVAEAEK